MELNFQYNQYNYQNNEPPIENQNENKGGGIKPHQQIIDFLEQNVKEFEYGNLKKIFNYNMPLTELTLTNGEKVKILVQDGLISMSVKFSSNSRMLVHFTNIQDINDFLKKIKNIGM